LATNDTITVAVGGETLGTITLGTVLTTTNAEQGGFLDINIGQLIERNEFTSLGGDTNFTFKVGSGTESYDDLSFDIASASATELGLASGDILSAANADLASTAVSTAIDTVNSQRATIGAAQNRLGFASANLAASIENAEAARSSLLDLDIASEISVFTSKQVLLQAGVAMLAQANQLPANLLRLLQ
jgi:flagellin